MRRLGRRVRVWTEWNWSSINRPHVVWWERSYLDHGPDSVGFGLSWGNGYSDPVWSIDLEVRLPRWWP